MRRPRTRFDPARAQRAVTFFEKVCVHTKGRYARAPFLLAPWQREDVVRPLFGTVRYDRQLRAWVRAYTLAWIELARKNGKSEIAAGIALNLLCADDEEGAEVYGAARDRDQAGAIYQVAKRMVELSPALSRRLTVVDSRKRIIHEPSGSFYQVVAADAAGNLGWNPHGVVFDEVISQPNGELWSALKTGMGTRDQPLMVALTTAGNDPTSFAAEEHLISERVAADPSLDPSRFVYMRNTPSEFDWRDEANWTHANPALGDFLRVDVLRSEAREADLSPRKQNEFRQFRLNQWVRQVTRWLDMGIWDENAGLVDELELAGRSCYAGLDLASTADFAGYCLLFPPEAEDEPVRVLWRFFLPEAAVTRRGPMRHWLEEWQRAGYLTVTPGSVLDYGAVAESLNADASAFRITELGYDRWNADQLVRELSEAGMACEGVAQTTTQLNAPSRRLEHLLGERRLAHGGNPIARWMADNVQAYTDRSGLIKPDKKTSREKIDGVIMLVNALHRWGADESVQDFAFVV